MKFIGKRINELADDNDTGRYVIPQLDGDQADIEEAVKFYVWLEACEWKTLPKAGGLEDQDEMLMNNIFAIAHAVNTKRRNRRER